MKFDKKVNQILEANFLSGLSKAASGAAKVAGGTARVAANAINKGATLAGNFIQGAEKPGEAAKNIIQKVAGVTPEDKKKQSEPFSNENKPKKGTIAYTLVNVLTCDKRGKPYVVSPNTPIYAQVIQEIQNGQYGLRLIENPKNTAPSVEYVIAKIPMAPYWDIYDAKTVFPTGTFKATKGEFLAGPFSKSISSQLKNWVLYVDKKIK